MAHTRDLTSGSRAGTRAAAWVRALGVLAVALFFCTSGVAQSDGEFLRVDFRVISAADSRSVVVDRGRSDLLAVGDVVFFRPRGGGSYRGVVRRVDARSSVVEMSAPDVVPVPGTRGSARLPAARRGTRSGDEPVAKSQPERSDPAEPDPPRRSEQRPAGRPEADAAPGEPRPWPIRNDGWTKGMPLLAQVRAVRPGERGMQVRGRVFGIGEVTKVSGRSFDNSFGRLGAQLTLDNPFGAGGTMRVDSEFNRRTERDEDVGVDLLMRRASYRFGGDRFTPTRLEFGRFLQQGMPEFGILDGIEWSRRFGDSGTHRVGASIGFLPELDEDFDSFADFQVAAHYRWFADSSERTMLAAGYQKTFHRGDGDRDLFVLRARHLPFEGDGWEYQGSLWVDHYGSRDQQKGLGLEVTQALLSARRDWGGHGVEIDYRRLRFPEMLRDEFLTPQPLGAIANDRYDRLTFGGWNDLDDSTARQNAAAFLWDDEDDDGIGVEFGVDGLDWFGEATQTDLTVYGTIGKFTNSIGGRVNHARIVEDGRWDAFYEVANHRIKGFADDIDDLLQHRIRASRSYRGADGWDVTAYVQLHQYDDEIDATLGFYVQRRFHLRETY